MNPASQKQLAVLTGLSKQAVSKAVKAEHITMVFSNGKKMVDLDGYDTVQWLKRHQPQTEPAINQPVPPATKQTTQNDSNNPSGKSSTGEKRKLIDEKLTEQIEDLQIRNQQRRADLIPKKLIVNAFNRMYSIDENQLKPIGVNVMPKISSVYNESNADKAKELLEYLGKEDDKNLKSKILNILNANEDDRINECNQILEDEIGSVLKNIKREKEKLFKNMDRLK